MSKKMTDVFAGDDDISTGGVFSGDGAVVEDIGAAVSAGIVVGSNSQVGLAVSVPVT